jgi:hypothetical protein
VGLSFISNCYTTNYENDEEDDTEEKELVVSWKVFLFFLVDYSSNKLFRIRRTLLTRWTTTTCTQIETH